MQSIKLVFINLDSIDFFEAFEDSDWFKLVFTHSTSPSLGAQSCIVLDVTKTMTLGTSIKSMF